MQRGTCKRGLQAGIIKRKEKEGNRHRLSEIYLKKVAFSMKIEENKVIKNKDV